MPWVERTWIHVGRVWSDGGPTLVVDSLDAPEWRGSDEAEFDRVIAHPEGVGAFAVGTGAGVLIGDAVVRDDSWIEVFVAPDGGFAAVQAAGDDYAATLRAALAVPQDDEAGGLLLIPSGTAVVMSAAGDGSGDHAQPLVPGRPGPDPRHHPWPDASAQKGLSLEIPRGSYAVSGTWYTELGDGCYARWRFLPTAP
jgi:hypothetical protein